MFQKITITIAGCVIAAGCASLGSGPAAPSVSAIRQALGKIDGEFSRLAWDDEYRYTRRGQAVQAVLAQTPGASRDDLPKAVLMELVDCLDDATPSASLYAQRPAPLGWVCHSALTSFVYHEEVDAEGDITGWDGYPGFPATPQAMQAAKTAWREVLMRGTYLNY
jgi:hypothetical protein